MSSPEKKFVLVRRVDGKGISSQFKPKHFRKELKALKVGIEETDDGSYQPEDHMWIFEVEEDRQWPLSFKMEDIDFVMDSTATLQQFQMEIIAPSDSLIVDTIEVAGASITPEFGTNSTTEVDSFVMVSSPRTQEASLPGLTRKRSGSSNASVDFSDERFLQDNQVITCEVLVLRIHHYFALIVKEEVMPTVMNPLFGTILSLVTQLIGRLSQEPRLVSVGDFCPQTVRELNNEVLKYFRECEEMRETERKCAIEELYDIVRKWKERIQPVNFVRLLEYVAKAKRAASILTPDMDVVLVVGCTGVGKSTLIHFLTGAKFRLEMNDEGVQRLVFEPSTLCDVTGVETSDEYDSTTRYIKPVVISVDALRQLGASNTTVPLVVVDCPGFDDTNGAEVDISNCIGIIEAAQRCRSVRVLFVCDYEVGPKGKNFKDAVLTLMRMLGDNKKACEKIKFVFTKYDSVAAVRTEIDKLYRAKSTEGTSYKSFVSLLYEQKQDPLLVKPWSDKPKLLLETLLQAPKFDDPKSALKSFVSSESLLKLKNQIGIQKSSVEGALERKEMQIVLEKVMELKGVNEVIGNSDGPDAENSCYISINNYVTKLIERFHAVLNRLLRTLDDVDARDVEEFSAICAELVVISPLSPFIEASDFLDSCFQNLFRHAYESNEMFGALFSVPKADINWISLLSAASSLTSLGNNLRKSCDAFKTTKIIMNVIGNSPALLKYRSGELTRYVQNILDDMLLSINGLIELIYDEMRKRNGGVLENGQFVHVVDIFIFILTYEAQFNGHLEPDKLRLIELLKSLYLDFSGRFEKIMEFLASSQSCDPREMEAMVFNFNCLQSVTNLQRANKVLDLAEYRASLHRLEVAFNERASCTLNALVAHIPRSGVPSLVNYSDIAYHALIFEEIKRFGTFSDQWKDELHRHFQECLQMGLQELNNILNFNATSNLDNLVTVLENIASSDLALTPIVPIGINCNHVNEFHERIDEFVSGIKKELIDVGTALGNISLPLSVNDIQRCAHLVSVCCDCHQLFTSLQQITLVHQDAELCQLPGQLLTFSTRFCEDISVLFQNKLTRFFTEHEIFSCYHEVKALFGLLDVVSTRQYGTLSVWYEWLSCEVTKKVSAYQSRVLIEGAATVQIVTDSLQVVQSTGTIMENAAVLANYLRQAESMLRDHERDSSPRLQAVSAFYSNFAASVLREYLADTGKLLTFFAVAKDFVSNLHGKSFSELQYLINVFRSAGDSFDLLIQESDFNGRKPFERFSSLADIVRQALESVSNDLKSRILLLISSERFSEATKMLLENSTQLKQSDGQEILQSLEMAGKNILSACVGAIQQANLERFSVANFSNIMKLITKLGSFTESCKIISFKVEEWANCCWQMEFDSQSHFVKKVDLLILDLITAENMLELEQLLIQLSHIALSVTSVPCRVGLMRPGTPIATSASTKSLRVFMVEILDTYRNDKTATLERLVENILDLPLSQFPLDPPSRKFEMLSQCATSLPGDIGANYRRLDEELRDNLFVKLSLMITRSTPNCSDSQQPSEHIPLSVLIDRLTSFRVALPHMPVDIQDRLRPLIDELNRTTSEEKQQRDAEKSRLKDLNSVSCLCAQLEASISQGDWSEGYDLKQQINSILHRTYRQYQEHFQRGLFAAGVEVAATALDPTDALLTTLRRGKRRWEQPTTEKFKLQVTRGKGIITDRYFYMHQGMQVPVSKKLLTEEMKRRMEYVLQQPSEAARHKDLFQLDSIAKEKEAIMRSLIAQLQESIQVLNAIKSAQEGLLQAPVHISVLKKFLGMKAYCLTFYTESVATQTAAILSTLNNFQNHLQELDACLESTLQATAPIGALKAWLDIAYAIEPTVSEWIASVAQDTELAAKLDHHIDLSGILARGIQQRLERAVREWSAAIRADNYMLNDFTTTRTNEDRDRFYQNLNRYFNKISALNEIGEYLSKDLDAVDIKHKCRQHITEQLNQIVERLKGFAASIPAISDGDRTYTDCCNTYDNLRSIQASFDNPTIRNEARQATTQVDNIFHTRFAAMQDEILRVNHIGKVDDLTTANVNECINGLIMLKGMSNRLVCYGELIDKLIDDTTERLQAGFEGTRRFQKITLGIIARIESEEAGEHVRALLRHKAFDEIANILRIQKTKSFTVYNVLGFSAPGVGMSATDLIEDPSPNRTCIDGPDITEYTRRNLLFHFLEFDKVYWNLVMNGIRKDREGQMRHIVNFVFAKVLTGTYPNEEIRYRNLIACVFAYWTLSRYRGSFDASTDTPSSSSTVSHESNATSSSNIPARSWKDSLFQPHPAQVIGLFRLFGIEGPIYDENDQGSSSSNISRSGNTSVANTYATGQPAAPFPRFQKHFVEILTGEGKSIVLAVVSTVMALLGYSVHCACYSAYLSHRDNDGFKELFAGFRVAEHIQYGTFGSLCEKILDADGNVRHMVESFIRGAPLEGNNRTVSNIANRPRLLLVDEVDVFFSKEYYGKLYEPYASIRSPALANMARWLWAHRAENFPWSRVTQSAEYNAVHAEFSVHHHQDLAKEIVKGMMLDLREVTNTGAIRDYVITPVNGTNVIAYKEQDGVNHNIVKGYQTMFHYLREHEARTITEATLNQHLVGRIYCGGYSYARIPTLYDCVMGVTGTLRQITVGEEGKPPSPQLQQLTYYGIEKYTYIPSVYGASKRKFFPNSDEDVVIVDATEYFLRICGEITRRIESVKGLQHHRRAVLVYFESIEVLESFRGSNCFDEHRQHALVITETTSESERDGKIRGAAASGQIVLLTRMLGRGIDFICYDENLNNNGGVHVLQTFLSEQNTEESQIMGRTSRQGSDGSYSLVLRIDDLEKFGLKAQTVRDNINRREFYPPLAAARDEYFNTRIYPQLEIAINNVKDLFRESREFVHYLIQGQAQDVKAYLLKYNHVEMVLEPTTSNFRVIVLMDATGSMKDLILMTTNNIQSMFQRLNQFMKDQTTKGNVKGNVSLQVVAYRNYNAPPEFVRQASSWEPLSDNPRRLFRFMNSIDADYGMGNEAIEVGFAHVVCEDAKEHVNAVILLGDAPPNTRENVAANRLRRRQGWDGTPFKTETYWKEELRKMEAKHIPVYCFHLEPQAAAAFQEIADRSHGTNQPLNVQDPDAAKKLTDTLSLQIMNAVGGEALVREFRRTYNIPQGYIV